jgi:hypothetical protein
MSDPYLLNPDSEPRLFGESGSGSQILIQLQVFDDQKLGEKNSNNVDHKFHYIYFLASKKDFQATDEASSPPERTSRSSKHEISSLFFFL